MCLTDDEPICAICKLFGKHKDHNVAKVSEAYQGRKKEFIQKLHLVHKKSEDARKVQVTLAMTLAKSHAPWVD